MKIDKIKFLRVAGKVLSVGSFAGRAVYAYKYKDPIHIAQLSTEVISLLTSKTLNQEIESMKFVDYSFTELVKDYALNSKHSEEITCFGIKSTLHQFDNFVIIDMKRDWGGMKTDCENLYELMFDHYIEKYNGQVYLTNSATKKTSGGGLGAGKIYLDKDSLYKVKSNKLINETVKRLKLYKDKKVNRSILFYGEPGSGKSTLIKSICSHLNINSFRIPANMINIVPGKIYRYISKNKNINALIIEDIDKVSLSVSMLETIDSIRDDLEFIFFSANNKENINKAFARMERIDEIIEINGTDIETGIEILGDEELAKKMEKYPVVCLVELAKRIKVLGKEEGYNDFMKDSERLKTFLKPEKEEKVKKKDESTKKVVVSNTSDDTDDAGD